MGYIGKTFKYLKKSGWLIALIMLVPSIVAGLLSTPFWELTFVPTIMNQPNGHRAIALFFVLFGDSWKNAWPVIVITTVSILFFSFAFAVISRHFRTGRLSVSRPFKSINLFLAPVSINVLIISLLSIAWRFVVYGIMSLVRVICFSLYASSTTVYILLVFFALVLFVVHIFMLAPMLTWAPLMTEFGYSFRDAASASFRMLGKNAGKLFIGLLLPLLIPLLATVLLEIFAVAEWIKIIVFCVIYLLIYTYICAYIMVATFDVYQLERRDVPKYGY